MPATHINVRWPDAQLLRISISYDAVEIQIRESAGRLLTVVARGHIGTQMVGFWDEIVIDAGDVVDSHPFQKECLDSIAERLGQPAPLTGSPERNGGRFATLVLSMSDGAVFRCVAAQFSVEGGRVQPVGATDQP
jgi:hypothetical protein